MASRGRVHGIQGAVSWHPRGGLETYSLEGGGGGEGGLWDPVSREGDNGMQLRGAERGGGENWRSGLQGGGGDAHGIQNTLQEKRWCMTC